MRVLYFCFFIGRVSFIPPSLSPPKEVGGYSTVRRVENTTELSHQLQGAKHSVQKEHAKINVHHPTHVTKIGRPLNPEHSKKYHSIPWFRWIIIVILRCDSHFFSF